MNALRKAEAEILELLRQLGVSDEYAKGAKAAGDHLPSVWEIQNGHIREHAREIMAALGEMAP